VEQEGVLLMKKALIATAGFAAGVMAMAIVYANCFFRTCENTDQDGFECSRCQSYTNYHPDVPFRFCPICGAAVMLKEEL
jgi:hypothetical protein